MDERAQKLLVQYGLSDRESLVYLHFLSHGRLSAGEIAKGVQLRRMEAYRIIKKLAGSGIVEATPGKPLRYSPKPIEEVVGRMMDEQMKKLQEMEKGREEVISLGRSLPAVTRAASEYKFRMIQGREQIYRQVQRMVAGASSSLDMVLTRNDLVQLHLLGAREEIGEAKKRRVKTRIISVVDPETVEATENMMRVCEIMHSDDFSIGRLVISDKNQILTSLVLDDSQGRRNERDVAIWTDSRTYADMTRSMFEKAFSASTASEEKLRELKTGRRVQERKRAIVDVLKAALPVEGWQVEIPGHVRGLSGTDYEFDAVLTLKNKVFAVEIIIGNKEATIRESIIAGIMQGLDIKGARLVVLASPYTGSELGKLASLVGVTLIDGGHTVNSVSRLRKEISG
jgi:sugar-specific transcriptional regulator TrmB